MNFVVWVMWLLCHWFIKNETTFLVFQTSPSPFSYSLVFCSARIVDDTSERKTPRNMILSYQLLFLCLSNIPPHVPRKMIFYDRMLHFLLQPLSAPGARVKTRLCLLLPPPAYRCIQLRGGKCVWFSCREGTIPTPISHSLYIIFYGRICSSLGTILK